MNALLIIGIVIGTLVAAWAFDRFWGIVFKDKSDHKTDEFLERSKSSETRTEKCDKSNESDGKVLNKDGVKFMTVGRLLKELEKLDEEQLDYDFLCWTPDGDPCYPTGVDFDDNDDLCISMSDDDEDILNVEMLISELNEVIDEVRVYVAAYGLFMTIEENADGTIFTTDRYEVSCHGSVFGEYEEDSDEE